MELKITYFKVETAREKSIMGYSGKISVIKQLRDYFPSGDNDKGSLLSLLNAKLFVEQCVIPKLAQK